MDRLESVSSLIVSQRKEMTEILTGFETRNSYEVLDQSGAFVCTAAEEAGSTLARVALKALRPFTMVVVDEDRRKALHIKRPFRFYYHRAEVTDAQGRQLGTVEKQFSVLRRIYTVSDASGKPLHQLYGPLFHPWTFHIRKNGQDIGRIAKQWGGLLKEGLTDADTFGVEFPVEWDVRLKALMLGAVFLIDFVHFENKGNG